MIAFESPSAYTFGDLYGKYHSDNKNDVCANMRTSIKNKCLSGESDASWELIPYSDVEKIIQLKQKLPQGNEKPKPVELEKEFNRFSELDFVGSE